MSAGAPGSAGESADSSPDEVTGAGVEKRAVEEIDRSPARFSLLVALVAGVFAVVATLAGPVIAAVPGVAGLMLLGLGGVRGRRRFVSIGGGLLGAGVVVSGVGVNAPPPLVSLLGATMAVVAWDVAENAISLGEQVGANARTRRAELAHAVGSLAVGVVAAGAAYGAFVVAAGGRPTAALFALAAGAVLLMAALLD